jgi:dolichol-phosphate mannosyltransferase
MYYGNDWALIIPLANEEKEFDEFIGALTTILDRLKSGRVYLIVDNVSKDRTLELCRELQQRDGRFVAVWAPENRNVVDAYLRGYREAYDRGHDIIIEMDAGLSHDPRALPMFLRVLNEGNECAFGSRFINGGSITESSNRRTFLSRTGTILSNVLLGTSMYDMTSGYQGFHRDIVGRFLNYQLLSKAHFYQTELRYLLRHTRYAEIPIHYKAPSPRVSKKAIQNSIDVLLYYFKQRLFSKPARL